MKQTHRGTHKQWNTTENREHLSKRKDWTTNRHTETSEELIATRRGTQRNAENNRENTQRTTKQNRGSKLKEMITKLRTGPEQFGNESTMKPMV